MKPVAYLHIGLEKTGTTSLQYFFHENRSLLQEQGFYYPEQLGHKNHIYLAACARDSRNLDDVRQSIGLRNSRDVLRFRAEVNGKFGQELKERPAKADRILLSNEHISSRLTTVEEVKFLRDFVESHCEIAKIIVYLRRQDRVAISLYSTRFRVGATQLNPVFPNLTGAIPHRYDYYRLLDLFSGVFGIERLTIRVLEKDKLKDQDLFLDFADAIGLRIDKRFRRPPRLNSGLRSSAIRFLAEFNRHVPRMIEGKVNAYRKNVIRAFNLFVGDDPLVSQSQAREFYAQFRAGNEQARERFLSAVAAPLFSEDFDDFPEQQPAMNARYEDAVEIAAELWKFMVRELQARDGTTSQPAEAKQTTKPIAANQPIVRNTSSSPSA